MAVDPTALGPLGAVPDPGYRSSYATSDLTRAFPGVLAVDRVSIDVRQGEIHGIIGKNGAGKTVLMSTIAGIYPATSGRLQVGNDSVDLARHSPANARSLGIALIPQEPLFAKDLSVTDNLFMGRVPTRRGLVDFSGVNRTLAEISDRLGIRVRADQPMNTLLMEDQQMLALGRALYLDRARVLLLDEITASLPRSKKRVLLQTLRRAIAERPEISVSLITHHIDEVLEFCDRVTVMRDGQAMRTIDVATTTKAILAAWIVGSEDSAAVAGQPVAPAPVESAATATAPSSRIVLSARSLGLGNALDNLSFELRLGEVLGIAGLDGSGKDELFAIIAGLRKPDRGAIGVNGKELAFKSPVDARRVGVAYLPKKRDQYAVLTGRSVEENALANIYPAITSRFGVIDSGRAHRLATEAVSTLHIKTPSLHTPIDDLSGGNRQKTMIARVLTGNPVVFLLNEPTRGVDLATKPELLSAIRVRLAQRAGVILTSESEEELVEICDRVLVLYRGKVVGDVNRGAPGFTAADLYRLVQGVGQ